ncbi:MAG: 3-hydroxyacyl-ACP dehydratase FabZ [Firmicutes bacterium]|nr:3-hydroxyacyl-ACP dehydratase FabZ [Bacillota bacterium]
MIYAKEINEILRQKHPFIQIDRILELDYGKYCVALKNVTMSEPCFLGHFPDEPIFPGALIIEAMAQAGGFIFAKPNTKQKGMIAAVDKVKFLKQVIPGDTMYIKAELISQLGNLAKVSLQVSVEEQIVAKGEITYSFN